MKFCSECGSIMKAKTENDEKIFVCNKCDNKEKPGSDDNLSMKEDKKKEEKIEVVEKNDTEHLPKADVECPECGHDEAGYWTVQTRAGDEPETVFYKCVECEHTWRDYS